MEHADYNIDNFLHITGESEFAYDMDLGNAGMLYGKVVCSSIAKGEVVSFDIEQARLLDGVEAILTYKDIPGRNDASGFEGDEPCLSEGKISFYGEAIMLIAAKSKKIADKAASLIKINYKEEKPIVTIDEAIEANSYLYEKPISLTRGNPQESFKKAAHCIEGIAECGTQEHWYLETQGAVAFPGEGDEISLFSSTQNPSEIQEVVARVLGIQANMVTVKVKRIGGGFGGKETWACKPGAWAALLAKATGKSVYFFLDRETDQLASAKRHPFKAWYKAAFNNDGVLDGADINCYSNGGYARDLSLSIMERAFLHCENAYYIPNLRFTGRVCKTNLLNFGAFRGFGAPQGIFIIENIIERIAAVTGVDALEVRRRNYFGVDENDPRHYAFYGQPTLCNRLFDIHDKFLSNSRYTAIKSEVKEFNKTSGYSKRGVGVTPVKFGISFTNTGLNQAGALVNIYKDGSVQVNHGGVEMGQGITAKMRRIAAQELGISESRVRVMTTRTDKVPNTSPTAASTGSDINGMAIKQAAAGLRVKLAVKAAELFNSEGMTVHEKDIVFENDTVFPAADPQKKIMFEKLVHVAYWSRVGLSNIGYYATPDIYFNRTILQGHPFAYFVYGLSLSEVEVNMLTGEVQTLESYILHDVGKSLHRKIDIGQIEGAYIQALGWVTTEELRWNEKGKPLNISPDTYKIPTFLEVPRILNVELLEDMENQYAVNQSKALGEPPFVYGISVWAAIKNAIQAYTGSECTLKIPACNEEIIMHGKCSDNHTK